MTIQEAINVMEKYINPPISTVVQDAHRLAIMALLCMEAEKPKNIRQSDGGITEGFCACGTRVNNYMKFCDRCGRKLDWSVE